MTAVESVDLAAVTLFRLEQLPETELARALVGANDDLIAGLSGLTLVVILRRLWPGEEYAQWPTRFLRQELVELRKRLDLRQSTSSSS